MAKKKKKKGGGTNALYGTGSLSPRQLKKASKLLTKLEIRPQVQGYQRLADQLGRERDFQDTGLRNLGDRTTATVSEGYKNLAKTAAEGIARQSAIGELMRQRTGGISAAANAQQTGTATGALGGYMESLQQRGAAQGGAAQAELARVADAERGRQGASNAAAEQFVNAAAGGYSQFASAQAQASQQRGAEGISSIQRDIASRRAQSRFGYNQDIREAQGKLADVRATKGGLRIKNILDLREKEREYGLGKAAVSVDRGGLALDRQEAAETARHNRATEADAAKEGDSGGGGGGSASDRKEAKKEKRELQRTVRGAILQSIQAHGGSWPAGAAEKAKLFEDVLGAEGVTPGNRPMIKRIYRKLKRKRT